MRNQSLPVIAALWLITGCPPAPENPNDAGHEATTDSGVTPAPFDAGHSSRPDAGPSCTPLTCASTSCGMVPDGCGHALDCGACACSATTFATDCPTRPCEIATGCTANTCVYEPVTCQFERCTCTSTSDAGCSERELRSCGSGCANAFCDPTPSTVGGVVTFGNVCKAREAVRCGTCDLGGLQCQTDGGIECNGVTIAGVNDQFIECNGGSPSASIVFVDPTYTGGSHTGAKEAPFITVDEASSAAGIRGARAIVIGGTPVITQSLVVVNGVSVLGGFSGVPTWVRDPSRRPVFHVPVSSLSNGALVGLVATDITTPTEVANVDFITDDLAATPSAGGASNFGARVTNAGALTLRDVHFHVGNGQPGAGGVDATAPMGTVPTSNPGQVAKQNVGKSCPLSNLTATLGGVGQAPTCQGAPATAALGASGATVQVVTNSSVGVVYTRGETATTGAVGGLASFSDKFYPGPGDNGAPWASAASSGTTPAASFTWVAGIPVAQGKGGDGAPGLPGRAGGGGGGGGSNESIGNVACRVGGGGGAGGAGGCGGNGGSAGWPGGWSFGLAVVTSNGLTLTNVTAQIGRGGSGGSGGLGTNGMAGATGGLGGTQSFNLPAFTGSNGGNGASGQRGGNGGDGANGQARGIVCQTPTTLVLSAFAATPTSSSNGFTVSEGCQ